MINTFLRPYVRKYRSTGVLIDTNLVILHLVARIDPAQIPSMKRTRSLGFVQEDADRLDEVLATFSQVTITPGILAETSNLLDQQQHQPYQQELAGMIPVLNEHWRSAEQLISDGDSFLRLGFTDTSIIEAAITGPLLVVTTDAILANRLYEIGGDAINFNHFREL